MLRLILPDLHIPFHCKRGTEKWLDHCVRLKPDAVDILGDLIDGYPLSKFDQNPARKGSFKEEVKQATDFLSELRRACPKGIPIHYSEGNHEARLRKVLWGKAECLEGLQGLNIPSLLSLDKFHVSWHPDHCPYTIGHNTWITHGYKIRKHSGSSARSISDEVEGSVICGHSHRMGWVPTTSWSGIRHAWECGHLCDSSQLDYVKTLPQWQQGWGVATVGRSWVDVQFVRVIPRTTRSGPIYLFEGKEL